MFIRYGDYDTNDEENKCVDCPIYQQWCRQTLYEEHRQNDFPFLEGVPQSDDIEEMPIGSTSEFVPSYTPQAFYAQYNTSPTALYQLIQGCPGKMGTSGPQGKWVYVWLSNAPKNAPQEFWLNVEYIDTINVVGDRVYKYQGKVIKDRATIDLTNIGTVVCYNKDKDTESKGSSDGGTSECDFDRPGRKIYGPKDYNIEIFNIRYTIYECQALVDVFVAGIKVGGEVLKKAKNSVEYKKEIWPAVHKVVIWLDGKSLKLRYEVRAFGQTKRTSAYTLASW